MTYPTRDGYTLGIDTARYQGELDFDSLRIAGIAWAVFKATDGLSWVDPQFYISASRSVRNGIVSGAYHFFQPARDAGAQAAHFAKTAEDSCDLRPVLDLETMKGATASTTARGAVTWVRETAQLWGCGPVVYSYPDFLRQLHAAEPSVMVEIAATCDLWIAHYTRKPAPTVPAPWTDWAAWQFDGDGGLVLPNQVDADFNWFHGDAEALRRRWGRATVSP